MACGPNGNDLLQRFRVRIKLEKGSLGAYSPFANGMLAFSQITKLSGLNLGETGVEEFLEQDRVVRVSDGIQSFSPIEIQARLKDSNQASLVPEIFRMWREKKSEVVCSIFVDIVNRKWCPIYTLGFYGCTMLRLSFPDQEIGQLQIGYLDASFQPAYVDFEQDLLSQVLGL